ncbi:hypothetical protein B0H11DRAFT_1921396 [Mycena galericulata]|nr:hypothetical protein B0H11DRAFT_1921396 [Mycena galericulata]
MCYFRNHDSLRDAARLRMRRRRAALANGSEETAQAHKSKALAAASRYREKNRSQIREADSLRRASLCIQNRGAEAFDVKTNQKSRAPTQLRDEGRPRVQHPKVLPRKLSNRGISDSGPPQKRVEPEPLSLTRIAEESEAQELCIGGCGDPADECEACECICPASSLWIEDHRHYHSPAYERHFNRPVLRHDGHEDLQKHSASLEGVFYGIISSHWKGVVTSKETLARMLKHYPDARHIEAPTWLRFHELWVQDCTEYHYHEHDAASPMTTAPSSPSSLTASSLPAPTEEDASRSTSSPQRFNGVPDVASKRLARQRQLNAAQCQHYASEDAFLGQAASLDTRDSTPSPAKQSLDLAALTAQLKLNDVPPMYNIGIVLRPAANISDDDDLPPLIDIDDAGNILLSDSPLLYAVSGHNRIFRDENEALATLRTIPGANLLFTYDELRIREFIAEEAGRMRG